MSTPKTDDRDDVEEQFLKEIREKPNDAEVRLVYADWLEEQGDPRAEFLRAESQLARLPPDDDNWASLKDRIAELRKELETDWVAVVSHPQIEACEFQFEFQCPQKWTELRATDDPRVRFCEACERNVYFCDSIRLAKAHAWAGNCVCVDFGIEREDGDLINPHREIGIVLDS